MIKTNCSKTELLFNKKNPRWLSMFFFHFGIENEEDKLKNKMEIAPRYTLLLL